MVTINGTRIKSLDPFSDHFKLALNLIKGGESWLQWAINATFHNSYSAANEEQFLRMIQQGLHREPYIYFPTFRASITTFIGISDDDLEQLVKIYTQVQEEEKDLQPILSKYHLLSYEQLAAVGTFLVEEGIQMNPLFRAISFEDQIVLHPLLDEMNKVSNEFRKEAIDFALQIAATVKEFMHFYQFYLIIVQKNLPPNTTVAHRNKEVIKVYEQMFPLANFLIENQSVGAEVPDHTLQQNLPDFIKGVHFIGYDTKSAVILNIAENILLKDQDEEQIKDKIEVYLTDIKELTTQEQFPPPRISQNGQYRTFEISHKKGGLTKLMVDQVGNLSLLPGTLKG